MATLNEIHRILNYEQNYLYQGRLFRDLHRDTATLYLYMTDLKTNYTTEELRIGFKNFDNSRDQIQTNAMINETKQPIQGLEVRIFVPCDDVETYQLDFVCNGKRQTEHWWPQDGKNLAATSESRPIPI